MRLSPPFLPLDVSQPFRDGVRATPRHNGVDYRAPVGTVLHALSDGVVVHAGFLASSPDSGIALVVNADDDVQWSFSHLGTLSTRDGDLVRAGQPVGTVGLTGKTTGPHVHLVVRVDGGEVDPDVLIARRFLASSDTSTGASGALGVVAAALAAYAAARALR